jgi:hypothetical protein
MEGYMHGIALSSLFNAKKCSFHAYSGIKMMIIMPLTTKIELEDLDAFKDVMNKVQKSDIELG